MFDFWSQIYLKISGIPILTSQMNKNNLPRKSPEKKKDFSKRNNNNNLLVLKTVKTP